MKTNQIPSEIYTADMPTKFNYILERANQLGENLPPIFDINTLRSAPVGTLGRSLADFLDRENLEPLSNGPRRKQLHDIVHVITNYGTDLIGEAEVQAFLLGAKYNRFNGLLMLAIIRGIRKEKKMQFKEISQRLWKAYRRGRKSHLDVDTWQAESQIYLPLSEVQAQFNL